MNEKEIGMKPDGIEKLPQSQDVGIEPSAQPNEPVLSLIHI